jgi:hypothetical protein
MTKTYEILQLKNKFIFFDKNIATYSSLSLPEGIQATWEVSSPQIEHPAPQNMKFFLFFSSFLWFLVALLGPDPADKKNQCGSMRIRIHKTSKKLYHIYIKCKKQTGLWIRIRINLNCWILIQIQEGKNDPQI